MSKEWESYGERHRLVVIDMQGGYLRRTVPGVRAFIPDLIRRIWTEVSRCIQEGGEVIFIESKWYGPTLSEIKSNPRMWITFGDKTHDSVLDYRDPNYEQVRIFFDSTTRKWIWHTCCGINTLACVKSNAIDIRKMWHKVRVPVWLTVCTDRADWNNIKYLEDPKRDMSSLLYFPILKPHRIPLKYKSLLDYLQPENIWDDYFERFPRQTWGWAIYAW